jgi:hypothetical protein
MSGAWHMSGALIKLVTWTSVFGMYRHAHTFASEGCTTRVSYLEKHAWHQSSCTATQIVQEFVDLGNYIFMRVM